MGTTINDVQHWDGKHMGIRAANGPVQRNIEL